MIKVQGFEWDSGNWPKCGKHGLTQEEIEQVFLNQPSVMYYPFPYEPRMRAIGTTDVGRFVFVVFTIRTTLGQPKLRPVSARFMHKKEIDHYEQQR